MERNTIYITVTAEYDEKAFTGATFPASSNAELVQEDYSSRRSPLLVYEYNEDAQAEIEANLEANKKEVLGYY